MGDPASTRPSEAEDGDVEHAELVLFTCKECYVYRIPPASTIGHRAELWNVDKWFQEVSCSVVSCQDDCVVRLVDKDSGELFAECPIPKDQALVTAVEPVVDSSRYYVLRIEDRETGRHAFIGVGFRERPQASDFNAALYEHLQYLRRRREAEAMRAEHEAAQTGGSGRPAADYSLKPGETITLNLPKASTTPPTSKLLANVAPKVQVNFVSPSPLKMRGTGPGAAFTTATPILSPPPKATSPKGRSLSPAPMFSRHAGSGASPARGSFEGISSGSGSGSDMDSPRSVQLPRLRSSGSNPPLSRVFRYPSDVFENDMSGLAIRAGQSDDSSEDGGASAERIIRGPLSGPPSVSAATAESDDGQDTDRSQPTSPLRMLSCSVREPVNAEEAAALKAKLFARFAQPHGLAPHTPAAVGSDAGESGGIAATGAAGSHSGGPQAAGSGGAKPQVAGSDWGDFVG